MVNEIEALASALQNDRLIKLVIGTKPEAEAEADSSYGTLSIWASALEGATEYFRGALRNQNLGAGGEQDVLTFPEDDFRAWQVLQYWLVKGALPKDEDIPSLNLADDDIQNEGLCLGTWVLCWIMGDKYDLPVFQNLVMIELIFEVDEMVPPTVDTIKFCFEHTPPGSLLRELMAEELAMLLAKGLQIEKLDSFDGIAGFSSLLTQKTTPGLHALVDYYRDRLPGADVKTQNSNFSFRDFMLNGWEPKKHWLHTREAPTQKKRPRRS
ncbi:hypothetical protein LTR17_020425 [Elasticomyces elasticus]|nr:hypothetical protein LTR17_020425 [Elasticomyces elasticus]